MGVWIETYRDACKKVPFLVTPCMGVWIETLRSFAKANGGRVTPCMGVWIETEGWYQDAYYNSVTPCMGVWIETLNTSNLIPSLMSHPVWVCGLKHLMILGYV